MEKVKRMKAALLSFFGIGAIMDSILEFSDAQLLTGRSGGGVDATVGGVYVIPSTNTIDLGDAYFAGVGRGTPIYLNVQVNTACNTAAATFQVYLCTSADNSTWATNLQIASLLGANMATIGVTICRMALPAQDLARYLKLGYGFSYSSATITVDAWLSLEPPTQPLDTKTWGWSA
jgi:hypothetical protein